MPGSIHEGGELGYSLSHAFGVAFDNPELIVAVAVGDGEAETGPLATAWHSNKFLNPARDGVVLPILHHGRLEGKLAIELQSLTDSGYESGAPGGSKGGSTAYSSMQTRTLEVNGRAIVTDSEGYIVNLDDWSEDFVRSEADYEGLELSDEHWEVIRYLRDYYEEHHLQSQVRNIIKHFRNAWGDEKGSSRYLHALFPRGGPQKQGNRLAGLLRVKGEH